MTPAAKGEYKVITDEELFDVICAYHAEQGRTPSMREIIKLTPLSSTSAVDYRLDFLAQNGLLVKTGKKGSSRRYVMDDRTLTKRIALQRIEINRLREMILFISELLKDGIKPERKEK